MDRAMLLDHLHKAERHIVMAEEHVLKQRRLVKELVRDGHDTTLADELLEKFERVHASHIEDRDRVLRELAELGD